MNLNNPLFNWFYNGPIGWPLFLIIALAAALWLNLDSLRRHLPVGWWRLLVILPVLLLLPIIIYQFKDVVSQRAMRGHSLWIVSSGILGGLIPAIIAAGYTIRFWGMEQCPRGHPPYSKSKGICPICARQTLPGMPGHESALMPGEAKIEARPNRKTVDAWLVTGQGHSFQIYEGDTIIGRYEDSDISLQDKAISRLHAKVVEDRDQFLIYDLGSTTGTWLNGNRVRRPETLKDGDEIVLGDGTHFTFTRDSSQINIHDKQN
ncbi:MAG: FHA domain-containing protein [Anaerolineae bacterium]|nr:FHA domain-containing protein [Anaerolineae bacterium]